MTTLAEIEEVIEHMKTVVTGEGLPLFHHLDLDCLKAIPEVWKKEPATFTGLDLYQSIALGYFRVVHTCHPRVH